MIEQAIYFRNSGIPISVATDMVDSAWDANKELWNWLRDIVDLTYSDPNLVAGAYQDGRLYSDCVQQVRPKIHIEDVARLYIFLLENPKYTGIFNAGFENISIIDIAQIISKRLDVPIETTPSLDPRSYRVNSDKIIKAGFRPEKSVSVAIDEIIAAFKRGELKDEPQFHNLKWMIDNNLRKINA